MSACTSTAPATPPTALQPVTLATAVAIVADASRGALATFADGGAPVGSLVAIESMGELDVRFTVPSRSEHARNLARDPRATLLVRGPDGGKVALSGRVVTIDGDRSESICCALDLERIRVSVVGTDPVTVNVAG